MKNLTIVLVTFFFSISLPAQSNSEAAAPFKQHKIGFNLEIGLGFQNHDMFVLENNDKATISFGGGYGIGMSYGYEFSPLFDLTIDGVYKFSELRPIVKNAEATVSRFQLSVTPAYIWNIFPDDNMRLKFGGGLDYVSSPEFEFDGSKIDGGFTDTWTYSSAFGFHLSCFYEVQTAYENWTYFGGIKYSKISYKFSSSKLTYPTESEFNNPDGSAIDIMLGMNYFF